jgi:integrase/recombinase XerD
MGSHAPRWQVLCQFKRCQTAGRVRDAAYLQATAPDDRVLWALFDEPPSDVRRFTMLMFDLSPTTPLVLRADQPLLDEAQLAAVAFLARYRGRTLDSYRADLRQYFEWAASVDLAPLDATRAHIELYRAWLDQRGLAPSTVDRRLSTICGYYRFAHIDGRIGSNPAQHVRRPQVHPTAQRGMDRGELAAFLYTAERVTPMHAALAVLLGLNGLRVSEACSANVEDLGFEHGHRTLCIVGKGNKPATVPLVPRTARTLDLAIGDRAEGPILRRLDGRRLDPRTAHRWVRSIGKQAGLEHVHPHMLRAAFIMAALDAGVPLRDVQLAARHADPRTTTLYDRRRQNYDRHAAYAVVAFVTNG